MFIELVDSLRCPREHDDTWLVASSSSMQGRHIMEGELGCPLCRSRYDIRAGVAHFGGDSASTNPSPAAPASDVVRLAALLGLAEGHGRAVLVSPSFASHASALHEMTGAQVIVMDPPETIAMGRGVSGIRGTGKLPFATASVHGAALDESAAHVLHDASRVVKPAGRVCAPADAPVPEGLSELARDELQWVAERSAPAKIVELHRRR